METPYSVKRTGDSIPLIPGLYKIHSIMRTGRLHASHARLFTTMAQVCKIVHHGNSTGAHSTSLWLAFLISAQQGRALECNSMAQVRNAMPTRNRPIQIPLYSGHTAVVPVVSALEGFHCKHVVSTGMHL